jgi:hypothetical protein
MWIVLDYGFGLEAKWIQDMDKNYWITFKKRIFLPLQIDGQKVIQKKKWWQTVQNFTNVKIVVLITKIKVVLKL